MEKNRYLIQRRFTNVQGKIKFVNEVYFNTLEQARTGIKNRNELHKGKREFRILDRETKQIIL